MIACSPALLASRISHLSSGLACACWLLSTRKSNSSTASVHCETFRRARGGWKVPRKHRFSTSQGTELTDSILFFPPDKMPTESDDGADDTQKQGTRDHLVFFVNGAKQVVKDAQPQTTLLQHLRAAGLTG